MSRSLRAVVIALLGLFAVATTLLGRWQLRRLASRKASNARIEAARSLPPLTLDQALPPTDAVVERRLRVTGRFLPDTEIRIRNRVQDDAPGIEIVSPFRIAGNGATLWVLRGFVRAPDGVVPEGEVRQPVTGMVTLEGIAEAVGTRGDGGAPLSREGRTTWKALDRAAMLSLQPASLPIVLHLTGDSTGPGRLPPVPVPALGNGPHLSYAVQWFGMALGAVAFALIIVLRSGDRGRAPPRGAP